MQNADRRRANGPSGGTVPAIFVTLEAKDERPSHTRAPNVVRKIFLRKGIVPSASGSAYLELEHPPLPAGGTLGQASIQVTPTVKISCAIHGPKPVQRSAPFSTNLLLNTHVKFAPFATRQRRGYVRDAAERDLAVHIETALRSVIIAERWPKSGLDIVLTVLEGDEPDQQSQGGATALTSTFGPNSLGLMSMLAGCITAASTALTDAGVDCVDIVTGGVAALVPNSGGEGERGGEKYVLVQDPVPSDHGDAVAACVVGYLRSRDELADVWLLCGPSQQPDHKTSDLLIDGAVQAAIAAQRVVVDTLSNG